MVSSRRPEFAHRAAPQARAPVSAADSAQDLPAARAGIPGRARLWPSPPQDAAAPVKSQAPLPFRGDPVSIILVLVIVAALGIAGLVGGEIYARNRANNVVASATRCVVQDGATASFGPSPFLLQHIIGHYTNISIHTAGNNIRNAKGMKADIEIDDVDLHGNADSKGTIGELDANITWTSAGIQETIQDSIPFIGGLVNSVTTNAECRHHRAQRGDGAGRRHRQAAGRRGRS